MGTGLQLGGVDVHGEEAICPRRQGTRRQQGHHTAHGDAAPNAQPFKSMCAGAVTHVAVVSSVMRMSKASFTAAASCSENLG